MRNILITGGAGFIGSNILRQLVADGPEAVPGLIESARLAPPPRARLIPARF